MGNIISFKQRSATLRCRATNSLNLEFRSLPTQFETRNLHCVRPRAYEYRNWVPNLETSRSPEQQAHDIIEQLGADHKIWFIVDRLPSGEQLFLFVSRVVEAIQRMSQASHHAPIGGPDGIHVDFAEDTLMWEIRADRYPILNVPASATVDEIAAKLRASPHRGYRST